VILTPVLRVFAVMMEGGADKNDAMVSNPPLLSPGDPTLFGSLGMFPGTVAGRGRGQSSPFIRHLTMGSWSHYKYLHM